MPRYEFNMTMDTNLKIKWIAALRSGKYKQTEGYLQRGNNEQGSGGFCCLGVLCDISNEGHWFDPNEDDPQISSTSFCWSPDMYPEASPIETTFSSVIGQFFGINGEDCAFLIEANDGDNWAGGLDFATIADAIEAGFYETECQDDCCCDDCYTG